MMDTLKSGVNSMKRKSSFSVDELCVILKSCRDNGVGEFHYDNLTVKLSDAQPYANKYFRPLGDGSKEEEQANLNDEHKLRQEQLDEALINDPVGYEQLLIESELK